MQVYLDKSVDLHFPAFRKRFNVYLTDGTHVQVVHCRSPTKTERERERERKEDEVCHLYCSSSEMWVLLESVVLMLGGKPVHCGGYLDTSPSLCVCPHYLALSLSLFGPQSVHHISQDMSAEWSRDLRFVEAWNACGSLWSMERMWKSMVHGTHVDVYGPWNACGRLWSTLVNATGRNRPLAEVQNSRSKACPAIWTIHPGHGSRS